MNVRRAVSALMAEVHNIPAELLTQGTFALDSGADLLLVLLRTLLAVAAERHDLHTPLPELRFESLELQQRSPRADPGTGAARRGWSAPRHSKACRPDERETPRARRTVAASRRRSAPSLPAGCRSAPHRNFMMPPWASRSAARNAGCRRPRTVFVCWPYILRILVAWSIDTERMGPAWEVTSSSPMSPTT